MEVLALIIVIAIRGGIGYLIGRNRIIGEGWSFILGAVLGLIGWIIIACSQKNNTPKFDAVTKEGGHK